MAIGVVVEVPGLTAEMYDAVNANANVENDPPAGLLVHAAGPIEGGFRIVDVWASQEEHDRFQSERIGPAIEEMSKKFDNAPAGPPNRSIYELHRFLQA